MPSRTPSRRAKKGPPADQTGQEAGYLRFLSEKQLPVTIKLRDGESVVGWIEYFDESMLRLTREGRPNLFIYKAQIRTITEHARRHGNTEDRPVRRRRATPASGAPAQAESAPAPSPNEDDAA